MSKENFTAVMDFVNPESAMQFANKLISDRIQFSFCPEPLSISYPMKATAALVEVAAIPA